MIFYYCTSNHFEMASFYFQRHLEKEKWCTVPHFMPYIYVLLVSFYCVFLTDESEVLDVNIWIILTWSIFLLLYFMQEVVKYQVFIYCINVLDLANQHSVPFLNSYVKRFLLHTLEHFKLSSYKKHVVIHLVYVYQFLSLLAHYFWRHK